MKDKKKFIQDFTDKYWRKRIMFLNSGWPEMNGGHVWEISDYSFSPAYVLFEYAHLYIDRYGSLEASEVDFISHRKKIESGTKLEYFKTLRLVPNQINQAEIHIVDDVEFNTIRLDNIVRKISADSLKSNQKESSL